MRECKGIFRLDICKLVASATSAARGCDQATSNDAVVIEIYQARLPPLSRLQRIDRSGQNKGRNEASPLIENPKKKRKERDSNKPGAVCARLKNANANADVC